ncbi:hypothetical protein L209DRAFT_298094 [Thermothelomyces heterothallicus CBS 203.75]
MFSTLLLFPVPFFLSPASPIWPFAPIYLQEAPMMTYGSQAQSVKAWPAFTTAQNIVLPSSYYHHEEILLLFDSEACYLPSIERCCLRNHNLLFSAHRFVLRSKTRRHSRYYGLSPFPFFPFLFFPCALVNRLSNTHNGSKTRTSWGFLTSINSFLRVRRVPLCQAIFHFLFSFLYLPTNMPPSASLHFSAGRRSKKKEVRHIRLGWDPVRRWQG